jgi:glycosyltransferase involved in cell wall biosynthesis
VTVAVPVLNEARYLPACLTAIGEQTYAHIDEVLVVDGGSTDGTVDIARRFPGVRVLDNPLRLQAPALNLALREAKGDVFVRVDGHCVITPDYVERCVAALESSGAAMVGGGMTAVAGGWRGRGIAAAMGSPFGAGPARFHVGGPAGFVDTVYLGAYRVEVALAAGGYATAAVSEDGELAIRLGQVGGVYYDPRIRSRYAPRQSVLALGRQFFRYGGLRAATVVRHPRSLVPRQLASPLLVVGLCSPLRRKVAGLYLVAVALAAYRERRQPAVLPGLVTALPVMHVSWGVGFLAGLAAHVRPGGRS